VEGADVPKKGKRLFKKGGPAFPQYLSEEGENITTGSSGGGGGSLTRRRGAIRSKDLFLAKRGKLSEAFYCPNANLHSHVGNFDCGGRGPRGLKFSIGERKKKEVVSRTSRENAGSNQRRSTSASL